MKRKKEKENKETSKIDLKQTVKDVYGNPIPDEGGFAHFEYPTTLKDSAGREFEKVTQLLHSTSDLIYQKAIITALQHNPSQRDNDVPDISKRSFLAMRLAGTKKTEFTSTETQIITKCAKAYYSQPGQNSIVYARIIELIDPAEAKKHLNLE